LDRYVYFKAFYFLVAIFTSLTDYKELHELFEQAPIERPEQEKQGEDKKSDPSDKRRPIEGDCPICFMEFEPEKEKTVWCGTCGNNIHKACFDQWAATQQRQGVRCVYW
jgi:hypothetical protein